MSVLEGPDLQVWNNAAFDNSEFEESMEGTKVSWSSFQPVYVNRSAESIESDCSKENQSPAMEKSTVSVKSLVPLKPLHINNSIDNSQTNPNKLVSKQGLLVTPKAVSKNGNEDERKIDSEIEEIEMEINRLSSRLEALRLEKAERNFKTTVERRGRILPAKFMDQKQIGKNFGTLKKIEEPLKSTGKAQRRGLSLGPSEIAAGFRSRQLGNKPEITPIQSVQNRGLSLGPSEIAAGIRSRQVGNKPEITPIQSIQNRRKSCFWKLQDIDELKVTKERGGKSMSLSPKSRKMAMKVQVPKQAATTVGSKKFVKKEDGVLSSLQPMKLFKDGEKSVPAKKPLKAGRVVASRYNQSTSSHFNGSSAMRKRSLPDDKDDDDGKRIDKKRASLVGKSRGNASNLFASQGTESRVKKKWEIPSEVVVYKSVDDDVADDPPLPITNITDASLPKIKTFRCVNETPRDSGPAKRVAELVGKKPYFSSAADQTAVPSLCQTLSFADDDEDDEVEEERRMNWK